MTFDLHGPGSPYDLLFDDDQTQGLSLPDAFQAIYGSDWRLPEPKERPYTFANFVVSRDGRISFNEPNHKGGNDISRGARHDKWLMGLLRARADAVLVGSATLETALRHRWTPQAVFREDAAAFAALRASEGRELAPLLVVATRSGNLPAEAIVLSSPQQVVLIATTAGGAERARHTIQPHTNIGYYVSEANDVNFAQLVSELHTQYGVDTLLCEGGAQIYGAMVGAQLVDDEFLTVSPVVVGNPSPPLTPRPGLIEGIAFEPQHPPQIDLLSMRRHDNYLFQRSRYHMRDNHGR